jgi:DNA-directed RNA polymerase subunit M/transcription elongation factor TFIIS
MANNLEQEITPNLTHNVFVCRKCNKEYKARNSLWYHEKKCDKSFSLPKDDDDDIKNVIKEDNIKIETSKESSNVFDDFICTDDKVTITMRCS